ncbi:NAD(P)H-binding protein [Streptococcus pacificus]|uniref:NAD(P)H-binding protein n=1 Tax=Streptococcus pacificus TaxID=2740577 RepID=A0ABS0ZJL2_9STRE|nr:NAD(P)H-binding protein [Streptococcus pacificus]MBJ8326179.1 NAD(P)H-binding protein [Streptococcus pacificus]
MTHSLIFGASGFLGQSVVKELLKSNVQVSAVTRSFQPNQQERFNPKVNWLEADLYNGKEWQHLLKGVDNVIDLVGIYAEDPDKGITFDRVIYQAAKAIADEVAKSNVSRFIYVSVDLSNENNPKGYLKAKREAENYLGGKAFDTTIFRPGLMYGQAKPSTVTLAEKILKNLDDNSPSWPNRPLSVKTVAKAIAQVVSEGSKKPIYEIDDMDALINKNDN